MPTVGVHLALSSGKNMTSFARGTASSRLVIGGFTGPFLSQGHARRGQRWASDGHPAEEVASRGPDEAHEQDMEAVGALPCARQTGEGRAGTVAVCTVGRDLTLHRLRPRPRPGLKPVRLSAHTSSQGGWMPVPRTK